MSYSYSFLKALGISVGVVCIPSLFLYSNDNISNSSVVNTVVKGDSAVTKKTNSQIIPTFLGNDYQEIEKLPPEKKKEKMNENEFCPKDTNDERRNLIYCALLKEIIGILEKEIGTGFSKKIYIQHPTNPTIKIPLRETLTSTAAGSKEVFDYYYKENPDLKIEGLSNHMINFWNLIVDHEWDSSDPYVNKKMPEILKYFPKITAAYYHKWRYMAILKRLFENKEDVVLKPIKMFKYYHIIKDPWIWGLMVEEAKYFYFSGGSVWAGWKNKNYILNFTDALNTYIPKKAIN